MARVNSIVGRYSGVVSYADGSSGSWHCEMECDDISDLYWSVDQVISRLNTANIDVSNNSEWTLTWQNIISQAAFCSNFTSWGSTPIGTVKNIKDVVHHLSMVGTRDDGTEYPISITYERGQQINHLGAFTPDIDQPDNDAAIVEKIRLMLSLVSDPGQPVMT